MFSEATRHSLKRVLTGGAASVAVFATALALAPPALAEPATAEDEYPVVDEVTPAAYAEHLEGSPEPGAEETLASFQELSDEDQEQFLEYLQDPEALEALLDEAASTEGAVGTSQTQVNGDIDIEATTSVEDENGTSVDEVGAQNLAPGTYRTHYRVDQNVMGVTVTRLELSLHYTTNGSSVTSTHGVDTALRNFNFVVNVSSNSHNHYVSGNLGYGSAIWNGRIGGTIGGVNFGIDLDKRHEVTVSAAGFHSGSLQNI